jgi:hypothetical protein
MFKIRSDPKLSNPNPIQVRIFNQIDILILKKQEIRNNFINPKWIFLLRNPNDSDWIQIGFAHLYHQIVILAHLNDVTNVLYFYYFTPSMG